MPMDAIRLQNDFTAIGRMTATPGHGASRPTFSPQWCAARDYVITQAERHGCKSRIDAFGNVHIRHHQVAWDQQVWLSGSHVDSVPHGGDYDGVLGVLAPLEVLRAAADAGRYNVPLELIIFAEEEGTTFGLGMLGSRLWAGTLSAADLRKLQNAIGQDFLQAGEDCGVDASRFEAERFVPSRYLGFIELHIEQGPTLWRTGQAVAPVSAINGRRQYAVTLRGAANHAGSTPMDGRHDALAGAAEMITALERLAVDLGSPTVVTVGQVAVQPNAINVISGYVQFTVDFRTHTDAALHQGEEALCVRLDQIAARRGLHMHMHPTESLPAVAMDSALVERLRLAAVKEGVASPTTTVSGALHDAAILAPLLPAAMLFVASKDGVSHNPAEFSRLDDMLLATRVLAAAIDC